MINLLLLPFSLIYYICHLVNYHLLQKPRSVNAFVICIGNVVVGGSGKTPYAIYLAKEILAGRLDSMMKEKIYRKFKNIKKNSRKSTSQSSNKRIGKLNVAFISRGYKGALGSSESVHKVSSLDDYKSVGDEALLLAEIAPTYICSNRYLAAKRATVDGADVIIMDDGFQNNTLTKDMAILAFHSHNGFGNGFLLPAGPMREPYCFAKKRVDKLVTIGGGPHSLKHNNMQILYPEIKNFSELKAKASAEKQNGKSFLLLTAIANGEKVKNFLEAKDIKIAEHIAFADHSSFSDDFLKDLIERAKKDKIMILTTQKDIVKISKKYQKNFFVPDFCLKE